MTYPSRIFAPAALAGLLLLTLVPASPADSGVRVEWTDRDVWFLEHYLGTYGFEVTGCSSAADLSDLSLSISGLGEGGAYFLDAGTTCLTLQRDDVLHEDYRAGKGLNSVIANYTVVAKASAYGGASAQDKGYLNFGILPRDPTSVPGFPNLAAMPAPAGGKASFDFVLKPDGSVRSAKLVWDGRIQMDTIAAAPPQAGDHRAQITISIGGGTANANMDGVSLAFNGVFLPDEGAPWWVQHNAFEPASRLERDALSGDALA